MFYFKVYDFITVVTFIQSFYVFNESLWFYSEFIFIVFCKAIVLAVVFSRVYVFTLLAPEFIFIS